MADVPVTRELVETVLADLPDPETGRSLARMEQIHHIGDRRPRRRSLARAHDLVQPAVGRDPAEAERLLTRSCRLAPTFTFASSNIVRPPEPIGEIGLTAKSVIAVGSGKGGVGKSTIAASLAYGLKNAAPRSA